MTDEPAEGHRRLDFPSIHPKGSPMIAMPYDYFLIAWFVLTLGSTIYVAYDQLAGNPEPAVMKWGFILVTLYMGPFGERSLYLAPPCMLSGHRGRALVPRRPAFRHYSRRRTHHHSD